MNQQARWTAHSVRKTFLEFFTSKGHEVVPSAPIVIKGDPTLMFTNAGMNQFKDAFLGNVEVRDKRVADTQKCLRVSGKHNDLEEVGHDTYHHTMFEMLGNWSFGDYFKKDAIAWAWELLTEVYGLEKDRLYVTVFEGDAGDDLPKDTEAFENWKQWIAEERILNGNKKDNFWEMGATGPCGPSSEIHIDLRSDEERAQVDGRTLVNHDHPLVVEIWNLVFMEFNRMADGSLKKLPAKHVDTGMGFERLCMALQGKKSNYDTDVFTPLIQRISELTGVAYGKDKMQDVAMRVVADHVRAVAFAIADGQLPSNNGAGYVIRRILRRAIRYGFSYLHKKEAFIFELVEVLAREMGEAFPEIRSQKELAANVIREEEQSFLRTLDQGLSRLAQIIVEAGDAKEIEGARVFELYDTFGFPPDLTALILKEKGFSFDEGGYDTEMKAQRERARSATKQDTGDWVELREDDREEFIGYDHTAARIKITRYRKVKAKDKELYQLVFNLTPFYPEGGGQVGDTGIIEAGGEQTRIIDTKKEHGIIIHLSESLPAKPEADFEARVDAAKRVSTSYNHSATHLLHQALREVLGTHVEQKGSLVHPDYLRFDFSHFAKVSKEELNQIEELVNQRIQNNFPLEEFRNIPMQEAIDMGAMALFGEKYGDTVRAIKFGDSIELCGGIHAGATGEMGLFVIVSESAVAAGIRRVEALTGAAARQYLHDKVATLDAIREELKNVKDPLGGIRNLKEENTQLKKQIEEMIREKAGSAKGEWLQRAEDKGDYKLIVERTALGAGAVKDILFQLKNEAGPLAAVIGVEDEGKAQIAVAFSDELAKEKGWHAGNMVRELAKEISGGGGGQPFFATAGGKDPSGLDAALQKARTLLNS
ncbi:MAG: alanine--tRNA ligase [Owenweeksia sp.]|nr:alanine--tRNA ligase [Owenweeksia sp.]MBG00115.1 alanine--tRNA ligase [Owenweeksia sp.]|tara:strand:- start:13402 stop:16032 length:2631 start_codon:yes stop_codon:yes gene_type:complete